MKSLYSNLPHQYNELKQSSDAISRIVYSFREAEIISGYVEFSNAMNAMLQVETETIQRTTGNRSIGKNDTNNVWNEITVSAGKFQLALRNKLISLRDI